MDHSLLFIGDFSERVGLSPRRLRSYASSGLLTPAAVDPESGYRYYRTEQIHRGRVIAALRRAGVPVAAVAAVLASPGDEALDQLEARLQAELARRRAALAEARVLLRADRPAGLGPGPFPTSSSVPRPNGSAMTRLTSTSASATDRGLLRPLNQDHAVASPGIVGVADGFGRGGELASEVALEALLHAFEVDPATATTDACGAANLAVWERTRADEGAEMGTTLTAASLADDGTLTVLHVGDSRAYLLRDGSLRLLTRDHLLVAELLAAGDIGEEELVAHPQRFVLTRAVGIGAEVEADIVQLAARPGDRLVLCTDGIVTELDDGTIAEAVSRHAALDEAAAELVRQANAHGGRDNSAVAILEVVGT